MSNYYRDIKCTGISSVEELNSIFLNNGGVITTRTNNVVFYNKGIAFLDSYVVNFPKALKLKIEYYLSPDSTRRNSIILNSTSIDLSIYSVIYSVNVNLPYQYAYIVGDSAVLGVLDDPSEPIEEVNNEIIKDETYSSGFNYMEMYSVPMYGINGCKIKGIGNTYGKVQSYDADKGLHFSSNVNYVGFSAKDAKDFNFYKKDWRFLSGNIQTTNNTSCVITYSPKTQIGSISQGGITAQVDGQLILYYRVPKTLSLTNYLEVSEWRSQTSGGPTNSLRDEIKNHNGFGHLSSLKSDEYNFYSIGFFTGSVSARFKMGYEVHSVEVTKSVSNYTLTSQTLQSFISTYCSSLRSYDAPIFNQLWETAEASQTITFQGFSEVLKSDSYTQPSQYVYHGAAIVADNPIASISKDKEDSASPWSGKFNCIIDYNIPYIRNYCGNYGCKSGDDNIQLNGHVGNIGGLSFLNMGVTMNGYPGTFLNNYRVHLIQGEEKVTECGDTMFYTTYEKAYGGLYNVASIGSYVYTDGDSYAFWLVEWKDVRE